MKTILIRSMSLAMTSLFLFNCSARQIQSAPITEVRIAPEAPIIDERKVEQQTQFTIAGLQTLNNQAGRPTFGIIKGFYQLPEAFPYGAISVERSRGFGFDYEAIKISKPPKPYAITPASVPEMEAISNSMNQLLDAGIAFKEVSFADAMKIMRAERVALSKKTFVFPGTTVPSGVDLLLSIERGQGNFGPVYLGRVIGAKGGELYALATQPDVGPYSLSPLIEKLVNDSLTRVVKQKR